MRRAQWISVAAGLAAMLALCLSVFFVVSTVDARYLERERRLLLTGLAEVTDAVPTGQESATIWDQAVLETRAGNQAWMVENLGEWMGSYWGFDSALVLDESNKAIHVMRDGATLDPELTGAEQAALVPLIAELRSDIASISVDGIVPYEEAAELGRMAILSLADQPVILSVKPIVPSTANLELPADRAYIHVAVQKFDETLVTTIADHFELAGLTLLPASAGASGMPLVGTAGEMLGVFVWDSERPALQVLMQLLPLALGLGAALVILIFWLLSRLKQTARRQSTAEERALYESLHDPLTDLANRVRLDQLIVERLARGPVGLHVLDICRFSAINNTLGNVAGDELLCELSDRLMAVVGTTGSVARIGGDEFAILQSLQADHNAAYQADRIMAAFDKPFTLAGEVVPVSCSIGTVTSDEDADGDELLRRAHIALSNARSFGPGRRAEFTEGMDAAVLRRNRLEAQLRRALEQPAELPVVYQPIFAADGQSLCGAEALLRWLHPVEGYIPPDVFIEIAEDRGLIVALGEHVLREACLCAVRCGLPWIAVNVSPVQLRSTAFCERVFAILAESDLEPHRLQLEITEGILLEDSVAATIALQRLRQRGIRVALDDFGTGYSSMNYLAKYSVDKIKVDKSFVAQLATSHQSRAIVTAIVGLAHAFQLDTTAEGVETAEQQDLLAAIGCKELQGYLFSRPLEREAFEQYARQLQSRGGALQIA